MDIKNVKKPAEMVRVNTRISKVLNDWLDSQSEKTGVPKSTFIFLALEQYKQQHDALLSLETMNQMVKKLDELERKLEEK